MITAACIDRAIAAAFTVAFPDDDPREPPLVRPLSDAERWLARCDAAAGVPIPRDDAAYDAWLRGDRPDEFVASLEAPE